MPVPSSADADAPRTNTVKSNTTKTPRNSKEKPPSSQFPALPSSTMQAQQDPSTPSPSQLIAQQSQHSQPQPQTKKVARRSSKPIIDWFQRKLAGTVRPRRASDSVRGRNSNGSNVSNREKRRPTLPDGFRDLSRVQSTPLRPGESGDRDIRRNGHSQALAKPAPISLNGDEPESLADAETHGDISTYRSSLARDSMWSPASNLEADEDASVRPLPPSSPPSPSPSRSSSSYLSDPRTFKSIAASTKPTTLLSVDLTNGMAHIAQAPSPAGASPAQRIPAHIRSSSAGGSNGGGSITFSALPPSPSSSVQNSLNIMAQTAGYPNHPLQAPQHTTHHPRNNPHPSSPPPDNASMLTLASSAFAFPGARIGVVGGTTDTVSVSHLSHFGGSRFVTEDRSSHFVLGDDLDAEGEADASVRALRPRSSRRGSWESEASGWSARMGNGSVVGMGPSTPSMLRDRSLWSASLRTGGNFPGYEEGDQSEQDSDEEEGDDHDHATRKHEADDDSGGGNVVHADSQRETDASTAGSGSTPHERTGERASPSSSQAQSSSDPVSSSAEAVSRPVIRVSMDSPRIQIGDAATSA